MASAAGAGSSSLDHLDSALRAIKYPSEILSKLRDDWRFLGKIWESTHKGSGHAATDEDFIINFSYYLTQSGLIIKFYSLLVFCIYFRK